MNEKGGDMEGKGPSPVVPVVPVDYATWKRSHPCAIELFAKVMEGAKEKKVCVFLDYDGTLSPIVNDPDKAIMSEEMRRAVNRVSQAFPTSIISGRALEKVRGFVQLPHLFYAGSHGLDISGPGQPPRETPAQGEAKGEGNGGGQGETPESSSSTCLSYQPASNHIDLVRRVRKLLIEKTKSIEGVTVEDNKFCCSVHFRNCSDTASVSDIEAIVKGVVDSQGLQMKQGRKVFEVRPQITWNKGNAVSYLMNAFELSAEDAFPLYLGDDKTDEDAFHQLEEMGAGSSIVISSIAKRTLARYSLRDPSEVLVFLNKLADWAGL